MFTCTVGLQEMSGSGLTTADSVLLTPQCPLVFGSERPQYCQQKTTVSQNACYSGRKRAFEWSEVDILENDKTPER